MQKEIIRTVLLLLMVFIPTQLVFAQHPLDVVSLEQSGGRIDMLPHVEVLIDNKQRTFSEIMQGGGNDFKHIGNIGNSQGFSKSTYWLRFSLMGSSKVDDQLFLELDYPPTDNVTLYSSRQDGSYKELITGESYRHDSRDVEFRNFVFRLGPQSDQVQTYYLRISTEGSLQLPLNLWSSSAFIEHIEKESLLFGIYFGVMFIFIVIAVVSYAMTKDTLFLFYGTYLLGVVGLHGSLNGFNFQYLWPNLPELSGQFTALLVGYGSIASLLFSAAFLKLWSNQYRFLKVAYSLLIAAEVIGMIWVFIEYGKGILLLSALGLIIPPVILLAAFMSLQSGYHPARYFIVAWLLFMLGVFIEVLLLFGVLPHTNYTVYALQTGSVFEVSLLGYALMKRVELLRLDKEKAQLEAEKYLHQLNSKLEVLVEERTASLQQANEELTELATHDGLTGVLNHNAIIDYLNRMKHLALRHDKDLAVIMLDIDLFKHVNDSFGHQVGDIVLKSIGTIIIEEARHSDGIGRFGGEEFLLVLPETDLTSAKAMAERIRLNIMDIELNELQGTKVSASLGIAIFNHQDPDANLLNQADRALYQAKNTGRNNVIVFESKYRVK